MTTHHLLRTAAFTLTVCLLNSVTLAAQGLLSPTAAPSPSMRTLTQVEPRTPIPVGIPGDPTAITPASYVIRKSGSYYLTGNLTVATNIAGIIVNDGVNDVSIDLCGFTLESTLDTPGTASAINFNGSSMRIRISNGSIISKSTVSDTGVLTQKGFFNGIFAVSVLLDSHISGVRVTGMRDTGIRCSGGLVENCHVSNCFVGIDNFNEGITRHCTARDCSSGGIYTSIVDTCQGSTYSGFGVSCDIAVNSIGKSNSSFGLYATTATSCRGISTSSIGLFALGTATDCYGVVFSNLAGRIGLRVSGTANTCYGTSNGGAATALKADIAIGCTSGPGLLDVPVAKRFNM